MDPRLANAVNRSGACHCLDEQKPIVLSIVDNYIVGFAEQQTRFKKVFYGLVADSFTEIPLHLLPKQSSVEMGFAQELIN